MSPTYINKCKSCGYTFETNQRITDNTYPKCVNCGTDTIRVIQAPNVLWKAGGYNRFQDNGSSMDKKAKAKWIGENNKVEWTKEKPPGLDREVKE